MVLELLFLSPSSVFFINWWKWLFRQMAYLRRVVYFYIPQGRAICSDYGSVASRCCHFYLTCGVFATHYFSYDIVLPSKLQLAWIMLPTNTRTTSRHSLIFETEARLISSLSLVYVWYLWLFQSWKLILN